MKPFPFTLLVSAHDAELTPVIQRGITRFIREIAQQTYPDVPAATIEAHYRQQYNPLYEALALLITKELKDYAETSTTDAGRGSSPSGQDLVHPASNSPD